MHKTYTSIPISTSFTIGSMDVYYDALVIYKYRSIGTGNVAEPCSVDILKCKAVGNSGHVEVTEGILEAIEEHATARAEEFGLEAGAFEEFDQEDDE